MANNNWVPHDIPCAVCGKPFLATGNRAMYCPECKKAGRVVCDKTRSYEGAGESKERINICLSCKVPASRCSGDCAKIRGTEGIHKGPAPNPEVRERREKVRKLFEGGMTAVGISLELGLKRVTVQNDINWLRERGGMKH